MGIDPVTHKPSSDALAAGGGGAQRAKAAAHLSHTAQWESARLEAEARLAREAKLRALAASASAPLHHQPPPGGLESPTSTLSFSESAAALASVLAAMQPMHAFEEARNKDQTQHWGDVDAGDAGFVGEGFTGLLLDDGSLSQDLRPATRDDDAAEADAGLHEMEEEKNYWNSILNLVNTSSSASMSTSALAPEAEAYSPLLEF
jgi:transcription factor MYB, plant